jgi:hypothetical protein
MDSERTEWVRLVNGAELLESHWAVIR